MLPEISFARQVTAVPATHGMECAQATQQHAWPFHQIFILSWDFALFCGSVFCLNGPGSSLMLTGSTVIHAVVALDLTPLHLQLSSSCSCCLMIDAAVIRDKRFCWTLMHHVPERA